MKYEVYNTYNDSVVGIAASLEEAQEVAYLVNAMCQEDGAEWYEFVPYCEIREVEE